MKRTLCLISFIVLTISYANAQKKISNYEAKFSTALTLIKAQKRLGKAHRILNKLCKKSIEKNLTHPACAFYALYTFYKGKGSEKQAKKYFAYFNKSFPFNITEKKTKSPEEVYSFLNQNKFNFSTPDYYFIETWAVDKFNKKLTTDEIIGCLGDAIKFHNKKGNLVSLSEYYDFLSQRISKDYTNVPADKLKQKVNGIFIHYAGKYPYNQDLKEIIEKFK